MQWLWEWDLQTVAACVPQQQAGLGGRRRGGLLLPGHGDGSLAVAGVHVGGDLGAREGQHAIVGQGAGDGSLVHVSRQAVPAMKFTGDIAMVILRGSGEREEGPSETPCAPCHASLHPTPQLYQRGVQSTFALAFPDTDTLLLVSLGTSLLLHFTFHIFINILYFCRGRCPPWSSWSCKRCSEEQGVILAVL